MFQKIKRSRKAKEWRGLSQIEDFNHAALIEWLTAYGGELEVQLFQMGRKDLVDLMNQHGREIPPNLEGIKDWLEPGDKGARLETWNFASGNLGGRFPFREHCKSDAKVRQNCAYVEGCGKEAGRCWWSYVKCLWRISRDVANGNIPSEEDWESLQKMGEQFVSKPRRTFRTRTDEEANFSQHIFYIDDPNDMDKQAMWWSGSQWIVDTTYKHKGYKSFSTKRENPAKRIISSCFAGGYLKMGKIDDIVDKVVSEEPNSPIRNLKKYELASAEIRWKTCPGRSPEKDEILLLRTSANGAPTETGMDDSFVWTNDAVYAIYSEAHFEKENEKKQYDRWAPPPQCLDLLRDVYDEEFFNYVKRFRREKSPPGSLLAGKRIEYPEDYRPEYSSTFCYFGRKPRFCSMSPCPIFSNEEYSFNQEHTKKFLDSLGPSWTGWFKRPKPLTWHSTRICTEVTNVLRLRKLRDERIRDMGFPVLHEALEGLLQEIRTLTETGQNTCTYCGKPVAPGVKYCPSTSRNRKCYDAYYDEVNRPQLKPVI